MQRQHPFAFPVDEVIISFVLLLFVSVNRYFITAITSAACVRAPELKCEAFSKRFNKIWFKPSLMFAFWSVPSCLSLAEIRELNLNLVEKFMEIAKSHHVIQITVQYPESNEENPHEMWKKRLPDA